MADFYDRCRPLVEETLHATEDLLGAQASRPAARRKRDEQRLEALYMTGGGSELPLVARMLREIFGRRVRRSAYTRAATAIGLAIQADATAGYVLRDKFTRHFGVWREAEGGRHIVFDPLFTKGTPLPGPSDPPLLNSRRYLPVHNIGHFRYLECSHLTEDGRPAGDITIWDDIRFPFDPALRNECHAGPGSGCPFEPRAPREAEESYSCDRSGAVTVTIGTCRMVTTAATGWAAGPLLKPWWFPAAKNAQPKRRRPGAAGNATPVRTGGASAVVVAMYAFPLKDAAAAGSADLRF